MGIYSVFMAALFTRVKRWQQPQCLPQASPQPQGTPHHQTHLNLDAASLRCSLDSTSAPGVNPAAGAPPLKLPSLVDQPPAPGKQPGPKS